MIRRILLLAAVILIVAGGLLFWPSEQPSRPATSAEALRTPQPEVAVKTQRVSSNKVPDAKGEKMPPASRVPATLDSVSAVQALMDLAAVTHHAVGSGDWSDPATWGGTLPGTGARVLIPVGMRVRLDFQNQQHLKALYVQGELALARDIDTKLVADTLVVDAGATFEAGTAEAPVTAEALISLLPLADPNEDEARKAHSATFVSVGTVSMYGQEKDAYVTFSDAPEIGTSSAQLTAAPDGWELEDLIVFAGNRMPRDEADVFALTEVRGAQVSFVTASGDEGWGGVAADYAPDQDRLGFAVNLSRNVAISSEPPTDVDALSQGTVLFLGDGVANATLGNVGFYGLGMEEGSEDGLGTEETRSAVTFRDGTGPVSVTGLMLVDAPESQLTVENSELEVANSAAADEDGGAWLTGSGMPSRLIWTTERTAPAALNRQQE